MSRTCSPAASSATSPWTFQLDVGAKIIWAISGPYTVQFSLDIFNLLNMQTTQWVDMNYTFDFADPDAERPVREQDVGNGQGTRSRP